MESLLFRLPVEVRMLIYEKVFFEDSPTQHILHSEAGPNGGSGPLCRLPCLPQPDGEVKLTAFYEKIILEQSPWRSDHLLCGCNTLAYELRRGMTDSEGEEAEESEEESPKDLQLLPSAMGLLQSCRQVYDEASEVLWSRMAFVLLRPLISLHRTAPRALQGVRHLVLHWSAVLDMWRPEPDGYDLEHWHGVCDMLAALPALRSLRVVVFACSLTSDSLADLLLRPLRAVKQAKVDAEVIRRCAADHSEPPDHVDVVFGQLILPMRFCIPKIELPPQC